MSGIMMSYISDSGNQGYISPVQIPNLTIWYNASASQTVVRGTLVNNFQANPITDGTQVTTWNDVTVVANATRNNAAGGNGPTYKTNIQNSRSALLYASASLQNLEINPVGTWAKLQSGFTMYVVGRWTTLGASNAQISVTDTNMGHQWNGTYWQVGAAGGLATAQSTTISTSAWTQHGMIFDGSYTNANQALQNAGRLKYRYQKVQQALTFSVSPGTQTSNTTSSFYIGGNNRNTPKSYMNGYLGEVLMWNRALNETEVTEVENYISTKWAI